MFYNRMHIDSNNTVGNGVHFERIRRVTGYLTGSLDRFNNAKQAEVSQRVKHIRFKGTK